MIRLLVAASATDKSTGTRRASHPPLPPLSLQSAHTTKTYTQYQEHRTNRSTASHSSDYPDPSSLRVCIKRNAGRAPTSLWHEPGYTLGPRSPASSFRHFISLSPST